MANTAVPSNLGFPRLCELVNSPELIASRDVQSVNEVFREIGLKLNMSLQWLFALGEGEHKFHSQWNICDDTGPRTAQRRELEEYWARQISEFLVGTPYNGPDVESGVSLVELYDHFANKPDPFIAVTCACQMLATYITLSRGYTLADLGGAGLDCRDNENFSAFSSDGQWHKSGSTNFETAMKLSPPLQPGACYSWANRVGVKLHGSHIVSVIRVDTKGGKQAQILDTGAALDFRKVPSCTKFYKGNYDEEGSNFVRAQTGPINNPVPSGGFGVPKSRNDQEIRDAIERLKTARPFSVARFFLATDTPQSGQSNQVELQSKVKITIPQSVVFMSPLFRLWGSDSQAGYSMMRCQFSILNLPTVNGKRPLGWWVFFSPKGRLAKDLIGHSGNTKKGLPMIPPKPRSATLQSIFNGVAKSKDSRLTAYTPSDKQKSISGVLSIIGSTENGNTSWLYMKHVLETKGYVGSIPGWLNKILISGLAFDDSYNPLKLSLIPPVLNDGS